MSDANGARTRIREAITSVGWRRGALAYVGAQLLAGLSAGVGAAALVVVYGLSLAVAVPLACAAALPLLPVFAWATWRLADGVAWVRDRLDRLPTVREALIGLVALLGFVTTSPLILVVTAIAVGALLTGVWAVELGTTDPDTLVPAIQAGLARMSEQGLPAWLLGAGSLVVFGVTCALAVTWAGVVSWFRGGPWAAGLRGALGLARAHRIQLLAAVLGGLTMGWFPGWLADKLAHSPAFLRQVQAFVPGAQAESLPWLDSALASGGTWGPWAMAAAVVVVGPLAEELVFRGFLWDVLERWLPSPVVLVVTSVAFAVAHLDPVHTPTVLLIGLFLGWLRYTSGSVVPGLVAHVLNNGLGVLIAWNGVPEVDVMPDTAAWALGVMTVLVAAIAFTSRPGLSPRAAAA